MKTLLDIGIYILLLDDSEIFPGDYYINIEQKNGKFNPFFGQIYLAQNPHLEKAKIGKGYKDADYFSKNMRKIIGHIPLQGAVPLPGVEIINLLNTKSE